MFYSSLLLCSLIQVLIQSTTLTSFLPNVDLVNLLTQTSEESVCPSKTFWHRDVGKSILQFDRGKQLFLGGINIFSLRTACTVNTQHGCFFLFFYILPWRQTRTAGDQVWLSMKLYCHPVLNQVNSQCLSITGSIAMFEISFTGLISVSYFKTHLLT